MRTCENIPNDRTLGIKYPDYIIAGAFFFFFQSFYGKKMNVFDFVEGHIRNKDIEYIKDFYTSEVKKLSEIYLSEGEGSTRNETGILFQNLFFEIAKKVEPKLVLKQNDFLTVHSKSGKYTLSNIQVDWHGYMHDEMVFVCECKAHLDRPFLSRAVTDISNIRKAHSNIPAIIFCGQSHISYDSLNYYKEECDFEYFFVNQEKTRSSDRPLYKTQDPLDMDEIENVYNHIKFLIESSKMK